MSHQVKAPRSTFTVTCRKADGSVRWAEEQANMVFDAGINNLLERMFKAVNYTAGWYVGLLNQGAVLAETDTAVSHPGWTENINYDEAQRPTLNLGPVGNKIVDNSVSQAAFTINLDGTIAGCFLSSSAIKDLAGGTIYSAAAFLSGDKPLVVGDVLEVSVSISGA